MSLWGEGLMRWWGDGGEVMRWWVCEVMSLWGGGLMRWRVGEGMRWWGDEFVSWWFYWVNVFGCCLAFMSLSASELFCLALRTWAECLSCVGRTKTTNSFQLIEKLKAKTASTWEHPFRISLSRHSFIAIIFSHEISIIRINSFTLEDTVSVWFCNFFYPEMF